MKRRWGSRTAALAGLLAVALAGAPEAQAQWTLVDGETVGLELGANLQIVTGYVRLPELDVPGLTLPSEAGLGSAVGRLEWSAEFGDWATLEVHNRVFWQTSTVPTEFLAQGVEVSRGADRRVDTAWEILDSSAATLVHDIDRLMLGLYFGPLDLYLGRQAVRWGVAELFPVADRFAPLSPFELDTLQRRGVDAVRAVAHLGSDLELDVVVADRGPDEAVSAAARLEYFGADVDAYVGAGRFYERASLLAGVSYLWGNYKGYVEAEGLYHLEEREVELPRVTAGVQRVAMQWMLGLEYHFNGLGLEPGEYHLAQERREFQRGESYFLGKHYLGMTAFYGGEDGWGVGGGAMANLLDPSVIFFPMVQYEIAQELSIAAGAYFGVGSAPTFTSATMTVEVGSEYGAVPDLFFLQMTAFF